MFAGLNKKRFLKFFSSFFILYHYRLYHQQQHWYQCLYHYYHDNCYSMLAASVAFNVKTFRLHFVLEYHSRLNKLEQIEKFKYSFCWFQRLIRLIFLLFLFSVYVHFILCTVFKKSSKPTNRIKRISTNFSNTFFCFSSQRNWILIF